MDITKLNHYEFPCSEFESFARFAWIILAISVKRFAADKATDSLKEGRGVYAWGLGSVMSIHEINVENMRGCCGIPVFNMSVSFYIYFFWASAFEN